jgi:hypothetical protein
VVGDYNRRSGEGQSDMLLLLDHRVAEEGDERLTPAEPLYTLTALSPLRSSPRHLRAKIATTPSAVVLVLRCRLHSRAPKGLQQLRSVGATQPGAGVPALTRLVSAVIPAGDVVECASISGQVIERGI